MGLIRNSLPGRPNAAVKRCSGAVTAPTLWAEQCVTCFSRGAERLDVATDATPEEVKRAQKRAIIIGRRFRLVHVIFGQEIIECSTFRALEGAGVRKDSSAE